MSRRNLILPALLFAASASAQTLQASDPQAYCNYVTEQAKAQSDLLRTPNAIGAFTQPDTGLPTQIVAGASLSLSDYKRAGLTLDAARKNCDLYQASIGVQQTLQYALPSIERDALRHRLELIEAASTSLDSLIDKTGKMVEAQNMTRPMLMQLQLNRIKLETDRADTQSKISAIYVPTLSAQSLKQQVARKQATDLSEQQALAKIARQNDWNVALSVGARKQIHPYGDGVDPYGQITVSYNLASRAIDRHLDRSVEAYGTWKSVQEGDSTRNMEVLRNQVVENIAAQQSRLKALQQEASQVEKTLKLVGEADTTAALDFRNQLTSTQLLLAIETGDTTFRLGRLQKFLTDNY